MFRLPAHSSIQLEPTHSPELINLEADYVDTPPSAKTSTPDLDSPQYVRLNKREIHVRDEGGQLAGGGGWCLSAPKLSCMNFTNH